EYFGIRIQPDSPTPPNPPSYPARQPRSSGLPPLFSRASFAGLRSLGRMSRRCNASRERHLGGLRFANPPYNRSSIINRIDIVVGVDHGFDDHRAFAEQRLAHGILQSVR